MKKELKTALRMMFVLTMLTGVLYPLLVTVAVQAFVPVRAEGSLVERGGSAVGSRLIGQQFAADRYFWPRPSATGYGALPSGGSNLGPTSDTLRRLIAARRIAFSARNGVADTVHVPAEMLSASASGLDPHISPAAALLQVPRVSRVRGCDTAKIAALVRRLAEGREFGFLGEPRVNVLLLNCALDTLR